MVIHNFVYLTTKLGTLVLTSASILELTPNTFINVSGCITFAGTLLVNVKNNPPPSSQVVLISYMCATGTFEHEVTDDPCNIGMYVFPSIYPLLKRGEAGLSTKPTCSKFL